MNVNANILINEAYDVITIPEDALMSVKGSDASVLVKSDNKKTNTKSNTQTQEKNDGKAQSEKPETNENMPNAPQGEKPDMNGDMPNAPQGENNDGNNSENRSGNRNIPDGYEIRQVVIGISDGTNVEIVSGLEEGETVAYIPTSASSESGFGAMMMGMGGRMPTGGGMPGSGGGGGHQGGGMPGGR